MPIDLNKTITLEEELPFNVALQALKDGKCVGIHPGKNFNYVVAYLPHWMNAESKDFLLSWHDRNGNNDLEDGGLRASQMLEDNWKLVVIDQRQFIEQRPFVRKED